MTITASETPGPEQVETIRGILGGDGECFHIEVTEEEYRRINGDEITDREKEMRAEDRVRFPHWPEEKAWTVCPGTLLSKMGFNDYDEVVIELRVRKVGQAERPKYDDAD